MTRTLDIWTTSRTWTQQRRSWSSISKRWVSLLTNVLQQHSSSVFDVNAFWEQHAYMGIREDVYACSGPVSFSLDTTRERIPTGSTHRYQIGKLSVAEIREMVRNTTRMLIARAHQNGELDGSVMAAIDVTKGYPFTGDLEDHDDDILGYKDGNEYYRWAVPRIVGTDVPLVTKS